MSKEIQDRFIKCVDDVERYLLSDFRIANKNTAIEGFVTRITFSLGEGLIEFLCGPPEYHVEIFISVKAQGDYLKRYDLAKLMSISHIKSWVVNNKPNMSHGDKIKAEIEWHKQLIDELKYLPEFQSLV
jgi:hypothetical protein